MADKTGISWTDATWNPIVGCSVVSPGCTNCYAMRDAARIVRCSAGAGRASHYEGTIEPSKAGPVWTGEVMLAPGHILERPLSWQKPRRVFVNSMGDLSHESVPDEWIDHVFAVMALAPQHTFQVLTKRSARMREYLSGEALRRVARAANRIRTVDGLIGWPLPNVWLGVTAEDQTRANERIPDLLATPAAVRFVSCEPMLGPVDLTQIGGGYTIFDSLSGREETHSGSLYKRVPSLDWVICGGESGPNARPMHPDWARGLRDQCAAAGVPFHFKQWGKRHAGRLLDGVAHLEFPTIGVVPTEENTR